MVGNAVMIRTVCSFCVTWGCIYLTVEETVEDKLDKNAVEIRKQVNFRPAVSPSLTQWVYPMVKAKYDHHHLESDSEQRGLKIHVLCWGTGESTIGGLEGTPDTELSF